MKLPVAFILFLLLSSCGRSNRNCDVENLKVIRGLAGNKTVVAYSQICDAAIGSDEYINVSVVTPGIDIRHGCGNVVCLARSGYIDIVKKSRDTVLVVVSDYDDRHVEVQEQFYEGITFVYVEQKPFIPSFNQLRTQ